MLIDIRSNLFGKDENHEFLNACRLGQIEKVERFLKSNKIDINSQDEYGKTALIYSAQTGYKDVVELLIKGAPISIFKKKIATPLWRLQQKWRLRKL